MWKNIYIVPLQLYAIIAALIENVHHQLSSLSFIYFSLEEEKTRKEHHDSALTYISQLENEKRLLQFQLKNMQEDFAKKKSEEMRNFMEEKSNLQRQIKYLHSREETARLSVDRKENDLRRLQQKISTMERL